MNEYEQKQLFFCNFKVIEFLHKLSKLSSLEWQTLLYCLENNKTVYIAQNSPKSDLPFFIEKFGMSKNTASKIFYNLEKLNIITIIRGKTIKEENEYEES